MASMSNTSVSAHLLDPSLLAVGEASDQSVPHRTAEPFLGSSGKFPEVSVRWGTGSGSAASRELFSAASATSSSFSSSS